METKTTIKKKKDKVPGDNMPSSTSDEDEVTKETSGVKALKANISQIDKQLIIIAISKQCFSMLPCIL